jgi:hypothetical protein
MTRASRWIMSNLAGITLCFLLLTLAWALVFVPLYTDEIGWRFQLSRFVPDGGVDRFINETCGANTLAVPPVFMRPVRLLSSLLGSALPDPRAIRAFGVGVAVGSVFLTRAIVRQSEADSTRRNLLEALTYTLLSLGILPLLLTLSRPEQTILIAVLLAMLMALSGTAYGRSVVWNALSAVAIASLAVIAMCYHLKAIFYLPVFLACLWVLSRNGFAWLYLVAAGVIATAAAISLAYWSARFQCPDDPILREMLSKENLLSVVANSGPTELIRQAPRTLINMLPARYVSGTLPSNHFMSGWLPPLELSNAMLFGWRLLLLAIWAAFIALGSLATWRIVRAERYSAPTVILALTTLTCLTFWAALQLQKNAYEALLYLPLLVISAVLLIATSNISLRTLRRVLLTILPLCLTSQVALAVALTPELSAVQKNVGAVPGRLASYSVWSYPRFVPRVQQAARLCGITENRRARRLLVDDLTYLSFVNSYRPLHWSGVLHPWNGKISDPAAYLRQMRSSGAVIVCEHLPADMRRRALVVGNLCCVRAN